MRNGIILRELYKTRNQATRAVHAIDEKGDALEIAASRPPLIETIYRIDQMIYDKTGVDVPALLRNCPELQGMIIIPAESLEAAAEGEACNS